MSNPNISNITPTISLSVGQTVPLLLATIALEELALAHLLNAEAEKLQFVLGTLTPTRTTFSPATLLLSDLLAVDSSVQRTLRDVIKKEMLLEFKFENILDLVATITPSPTAFLFVSNNEGNTVSIFDITDRINPAFIREFGGPPQLEGPTGLAITGTTLYVANFNSSMNRSFISIYDISTPTDPVFVRTFGERGELARPMGLAIFNDELFVANQNNNSIQQYNIFVPLNPTLIGPIVEGELVGPNGLAIKDRTLYVANQFSNTIQTYQIIDSMPQPSGSFGDDEELDGPTGLAVNGDVLYAANFNISRAEVYSISPPVPIKINEFGMGELSGAQHMVIYPPNPCYVANMNNNTVSIYDVSFPPNPTRVGQITSHLRAPVGVAIFFPGAPI
ncbi:hypothetical protein [Neobacillus sp. 114]|uniref:LVIVD repeat-containing protein n=1 Tax=Neobacillus sp. 114 TaxID=3048535 RepID=UPI0032E45AD6